VKISWLTLFKEVTAVYSENQTNPMSGKQMCGTFRHLSPIFIRRAVSVEGRQARKATVNGMFKPHENVISNCIFYIGFSE
jgi:hypothetical protein